MASSTISITQDNPATITLAFQNSDGSTFDLTGYGVTMSVRRNAASLPVIVKTASVAAPSSGQAVVSLTITDAAIDVRGWRYSVSLTNGSGVTTTSGLYLFIVTDSSVDPQTVGVTIGGGITATVTLSGAPGAAGVGVAVGGTPGQVLTKNSGTDYDTSWGTPAAAGVSSVAGKSGTVTLVKGDVGLGNVDNTSDVSKPVSTAQATAIAGKYSKPDTGIPRTDLDTATQTSLSKADSALQTAPVTSVATRTGAVTLSASDVGLGNVNNTSDASKPISTSVASALAGKQPVLASAASQTSGFTAASGNYYPVDATSGAITVVLPTSTAGAQVAIKKTDASSNNVTISGTINGSTSTLPLKLQNQGKVLISDGGSGWNIYAGDINLAALDTRYASYYSTDSLGTQWQTKVNPDGSPQNSEVLDAVMRKARNEVAVVVNWLAQTPGSRAIMSEVGWPQNQDTSNWNQVIAVLMRKYTAAGIPFMSFTAQGSPGPSTGQVTIYTRSSGTYSTTSFDTALATAAVPESFTPIAPNFRAIDVFGGCANDGGGSGTIATMNNSSPGTYGTSWWYEGQGSYNYLASRGFTVARVGFRLERLYPSFYAALNAAELARIQQQVTYAQNAGMKVVLDCHNYALYVTSSAVNHLNSTGFPIAALTDFWTRFSTAFKGNNGVQAYSLMNEPHDVVSGVNGESGAKMWEVASQASLNAIRANGDTAEVHVACYEFEHFPWVAKNHLKPWIVDSANNFRYEGHHYPYFNRLGAANYPNTYAQELTFVPKTWINQMNPGATWSSLSSLTYNQLP